MSLQTCTASPFSISISENNRLHRALMASTIARNLNLCFSKIKRPPLLPPPPPDNPTPPLPNPISNSNSNSILIKNFNSLYDPSLDNHPSTSTATIPDSELETATPDFAAVFASQRFFFSSPGRSNSITESSSSLFSSSSMDAASSSLSPESDGLLGGGIPIPTFSPDPYLDFRRSMQEMVEARELIDVRANWDYLHELLMCYLALNPKSTHKFIVGAFADLLVTLMASPVVGDSCR